MFRGLGFRVAGASRCYGAALRSKMGKCRHVKYDGQFFEHKPPKLAFPIINQVRTSFSYLGQIVIAQLRHGGILPCSRVMSPKERGLITTK